jgi:hypothetical protein
MQNRRWPDRPEHLRPEGKLTRAVKILIEGRRIVADP